MGTITGKRFREYGVAVLAVALAVGIRWLIDPCLGDQLPLITLYVAVAAAVWVGGYRPALLAAALGFLALYFLLIQPRGPMVVAGAHGWVGLSAYLLFCAVIIGFGEVLRRGRHRLASTAGKVEQSEAAHQAAMQQLEIVADSMAAPVSRCSRDFRYLWVSKPYADWIGRSPSEIVDRTVVEVIGAQAFLQLRPYFDRVLAGHVVRYEEQVHFQGIGPRWINAIYTPTRDATGTPDGWVAVVQDITQQRQMQQALAESEERFRQLAESINEVFWMADPHATQILYISPAYERVWGRSCQSLYEQPRSFLDAIHADDRERVRTAALEKHSRGEATDEEYRVMRPDGSVRWIRDRAFPVRDAAGRIYRMVGIAEDVTETKRAQEALHEASRRKDEFLATLAHELRNPLAPIRNAAHVLRMRELADPQLADARDIIDRQVQQMVRLIDDLLDISRITRGKLQLRRERIALAAVIHNAVEAARPAVDSHTHQLHVALPPEALYLDADPIRLAQVFANLLNNAAKYTERGGHIWLTAERHDGDVIVSVRDTGIGIAANHLPRLFEMFSQAAPALERSQGGLGIGLALVRGLVELHGGSITAQSAGSGRGSEFTVRLPLVATALLPPPESNGDGAECRSRPKCRILIADDLHDAVDSLAMMLRLLGHDIHTAYDGLEAVQAAATFRPEVMLLDIGMPKMNGYEAAHHIRQQPWGTEVLLVAVTGWGQAEDKRRAYEAGFDHHLTKPVAFPALEELLARRAITAADG
jgi:PAS domain S-box-containing protein